MSRRSNLFVCEYYGKQFLVRDRPARCLCTDHMNLVALQAETLSSSPKHARWRAWIEQSPHYIRHVPGLRNKFADYLSRCYAEEVKPAHLIAITLLTQDGPATPPPSPITLNEMLAEVHNASVGGHRGSAPSKCKLSLRFHTADLRRK